MPYTILTSLGVLGAATSTLECRGRGYIHATFRAGSAATSNPSVVASTASITVALQALIPGTTECWADVQTWAIVPTEIVPGRDLAYFNPEINQAYRMYIKSYTSGYVQARLWEG